MTSAADFHLISWRNFFGLSAVVVAVLIPVGIRWYFRGELAEVAAVEVAEDPALEDGGPPIDKGKQRARVFYHGLEEDLESNSGSETRGDKGKGVARNEREWLFGNDEDFYTDEDGVAYDDEPLPPPPKVDDKTEDIKDPLHNDVSAKVKQLG